MEIRDKSYKVDQEPHFVVFKLLSNNYGPGVVKQVHHPIKESNFRIDFWKMCSGYQSYQ